MITMKGKYNSANIMIDAIDETTKEQIQNFLNHPAFGKTYIAIMPDCHAGAGAVIGLTMKMNEYIIPNIVGVDIGCGMLSGKFDSETVDLPKLDEFIKAHIPCGFHINETPVEADPKLKNDVAEICAKIDTDSGKALRAVGSLGGGNHFIEAGKGNDGKIWVTIHSGSRNFGLKVANYHQQKAKETLKKYFIKDQYKALEFMLVDSKEGQDYLRDVKVAQLFALHNRETMMLRLCEFMQGNATTISSIHNFIGDDGIIRKGATPANEGQDVIIPFNMRDGIAICKGRGNSKYNNSAPHGAGRILSRKQAKATLQEKDFKETMERAGVYTTTATADTLDEAPGAYKDMDIIIENIRGTVDIVELIKPIYNFKAGGD